VARNAPRMELPMSKSVTPPHDPLTGSANSTTDADVEHDCMTAQELASWMRVDRKTVYEYAARNVIPCRRLGRRLVFLRPAVVAWLARSPTVGAPHNPSAIRQ
jgi:excisionase family DNA binding protein